MSEQTRHQDNVGLDTSAFPALPRNKPSTSFAAWFERISIAQMSFVLLAAVLVWQWFSVQHDVTVMREQLARKIAEMDGNSKANQMLLSNNQDESRELAAKLVLLETRFAESQGQRAALEALYNDLSVSRDETALAEVEQLLLVAGQQLQLSANVKAALIALQTADARLQRMGRPVLNGLRKSIAKDMGRLRALPVVDVAALNAQLDGMIANVDGMSLPYQQHNLTDAQQPAAVAGADSVWQKLLREIRQEAAQLVRIENTGKAELPLLPPSQEFFLRENLKMHLLMARLNLLARDEAGFKQEIRTSQQWVSRYFDPQSGATARQIEGMRKLAGTSINIEMPDISQSLNMVRNYRLARENEPRANFDAREPRARAKAKGAR